MSAPERVAQAGVKIRGRIFTGANHKAAILSAANAFGLNPSAVWGQLTPDDQGFVTSGARFVSRAEAWRIAKRAGQIRRDKSRAGAELHSEDLT